MQIQAHEVFKRMKSVILYILEPVLSHRKLRQKFKVDETVWNVNQLVLIEIQLQKSLQSSKLGIWKISYLVGFQVKDFKIFTKFSDALGDLLDFVTGGFELA